MDPDTITDLAWAPKLDRDGLVARQRLLAALRSHLAASGVLEVDTPLLVAAGVTEPTTPAFAVTPVGATEPVGFLATSPEYHMKRLLAAGSGSIFQLLPAFRADERGRHHDPEFLLLEWYRVGATMDALIDEIDQLLQRCADLPAARRVRYRDAFLAATGLDPIDAATSELVKTARRHGPGLALGEDDRAFALDLLFSEVVMAGLGDEAPVFVTHFPAAQASLARLADDGLTALRFELVVRGLELANGFEELTDPEEQRARFVRDNERRRAEGLPEMPIDEALLAALAHGLPACSGVALGVDRLFMVMHDIDDIQAVRPFRALT